MVSQPPPLNPKDISHSAVRVSWDAPQDPNGVIHSYTVNLVLLATEPDRGDRKRRAGGIAEGCVIGGFEAVARNKTLPGDVTSTVLEDLSECLKLTIAGLHGAYFLNALIYTLVAPFSTYEFQVQATTDIGSGPFSPARLFSTQEYGEHITLMGHHTLSGGHVKLICLQQICSLACHNMICVQ